MAVQRLWRRPFPLLIAAMNVFTLALLCASSLFSANALAQWQWLDAQGRKVYSDLPPPMQVPADRILKQPRSAKPAATSPAAATPPAASRAIAAPASSGKGTDAELQARKTTSDAEQAEAEDLDQRRQDNCAHAKAAQTALSAGRLLAHTNAQGERVFMDEAARSAQRQRAQEVVDNDCGPRPR